MVRPPRDHRRTPDGIFRIAGTGAPWRDLPEEFGIWSSIYRQFRRWTLSGVREVMLAALADADPDAAALQMVDRTTVTAHHCAAGAERAPLARFLAVLMVASRPNATRTPMPMAGRSACRSRLAMIPTKSTREVQFTVDHAPYSLRNRTARHFNKIRNARRVATRYDKTAASFMGFVELTSSRSWLRFGNAT